MAQIVKSDAASVRDYLDRLRAEPRDPSGSEVLKVLDAILQLIESRDAEDLRRSGAKHRRPAWRAVRRYDLR